MTQQEDQTFRSRLHNAYHKLCKSHLVNRKDTSEGSLKFFEERLNEAMPRDSVEHDQVRVIKDLYHNAPQLTYRSITAEKDGMSKQAPYVLWTNAWCITRHFGVEGVVYLDWDSTQNMYHVRLPDQVSDADNNKKDPVPRSPKNYQESPFKYQTPRDKKTKYQKPREKKPVYQKNKETTDNTDNKDWKMVGEKKYRNNSRKRKELYTQVDVQEPSKPVETPSTIAALQASVEQAIKNNEEWA